MLEALKAKSMCTSHKVSWSPPWASDLMLLRPYQNANAIGPERLVGNRCITWQTDPLQNLRFTLCCVLLRSKRRWLCRTHTKTMRQTALTMLMLGQPQYAIYRK